METVGLMKGHRKVIAAKFGARNDDTFRRGVDCRRELCSDEIEQWAGCWVVEVMMKSNVWG